MDKSNIPLDPNSNCYNGFFNIPPQEPFRPSLPVEFQEPFPPTFHAESLSVRHRSLIGRNARATSMLSEPAIPVTFSQTPDVSTQNMRNFEEDNVCHEMGELSFFEDTMGVSSPPVGSLSRSSSMTAEQDPDTQTPVVTCLTPPIAEDVPSRCESVRPFSHVLEDDSNAAESPCKFPRLGDLNGISSRTFEPRQQRKPARLSRLRGVTLSVSSLPTPEFPLLVAPCESVNHVVLDGLTIPVIPGINGHSNKHIRISAETTFDFITGKIKLPPGFKLLIWDARFIYEYEGGHIRGARRFEVKNIRSQLEEIVRNARAQNEKYYVICYCQFSSSRAPKLRDILFSAETDIMLSERKGVQLFSEEDSRFRVFIVDGGYDQFFSKFPDLCEPRGYTRELDDLEKRGKYRPEYEEDIKGSCASRVLMPSPGSLIRRSQSSRDIRGRLRCSCHIESNMGQEDLYCGISDDENDAELSPCAQDSKVRPLFFDDDM